MRMRDLLVPGCSDKSLHNDKARKYLETFTGSPIVGDPFMNSEHQFMIGITEIQSERASVTIAYQYGAPHIKRYLTGTLYSWPIAGATIQMSHWPAESTPYKISILVEAF